MTGEVCHVNDTMKAYGMTPDLTISLYSLGMILGIGGNMLILCVICLTRRPWFAHDILFMNMIFADLLMLLTIPAWVYYLLNYTQVSRLECVGLSFAFYVPLFLHSDMIVAIAVERYQNLVRNTPVSCKTAVISCTLLWTTVTLVTSPYYMLRETQEPDSCILGNYTWHVSSPYRTVMDVAINLWTFVVPAGVILFLSIRIHSCSWGNRKLNTRTSRHLDAMAINMLFFNGLFNLVMFRDIVTDFSSGLSCHYLRQEHFFRMMGIAFVFARPIFNPILYVSISKKLLRSIFLLFMRVPYDTLDSEHAELMVQGKINNEQVPDPFPRECESML
ncbi:US27D [Papio ursinus cytomegalovirus]|uniref:US27D n=1 Tax=Papiine betaherpesvirus 4 TaxID=2560624 RepID=A0A0F7G9J8_9BETA|nr:US27D [Papio ursinus cytomegalovirus]AKG51567.1 US27D [Papiine betaherpesvirus 4]